MVQEKLVKKISPFFPPIFVKLSNSVTSLVPFLSYAFEIVTVKCHLQGTVKYIHLQESQSLISTKLLLSVL